jgi:hypothetical protein
MNICTVTLERSERLDRLISTYHPDLGMEFSYTLTPPVVLGAKHMRITGYLKEYPDTHITVSVNTGGRRSCVFTIFARTKGEERDETYYQAVEKWIDKYLCEPTQTSPDQFEQHILALINADYIR